VNPILEETIYLDFIVSNSTGAAADADATPTVEVFEDATDTAILAPTATKRTSKTGDYRIPVACTAAKSYNVVVSATVGGIAAKAKIASFQVRAASSLTLPAGLAATGTLTTTSFTATGASLSQVAGSYVNQFLLFTSGNQQGFPVKINSHTYSGGTHTFGCDALNAAPANTDAFVILGKG
jgi:hypothetical protein